MNENKSSNSERFQRFFGASVAKLKPLSGFWPSWGTFALALIGAAILFLTKATNTIYLDDSLITLHYVENVLEGKGLVFNEGERIMGFSNPAYTISQVIITQTGIHPITAANLTFIGLSLGIMAALGFLLMPSRAAEIGPLICLTFMLSQGYWLSLKGMETPLLILAAVTAAVFFQQKMYIVGCLFAAVGGLSRPDGIVIPGLYTFALIAVACFNREDKQFVKRCALSVGIMAAIGLTWLIFAQLYYGSVLPMSVRAKAIHTISPSDLLYHQSLAKHIIPNKLIVYLGVAFAFLLVLFQERRYLVIFSWGFFNFLLLIVGHAPYYHWYFVPMMICFLSLGIVGAYCLLRSIIRQELAPFIGPAVGLLLFGYGVSQFDSSLIKNSLTAGADPGKAESGLVISRQAEPDDVVAAGDIGFAGYYTDRYVLDTQGLISPQSHPYISAGDNYGLMLEFRPDWIFGAFSFRDDYSRGMNYEFIARPSNYEVLKKRAWNPKTILANSPELRSALEEGVSVCFLDWPAVACPPDLMNEMVRSEFPNATEPVFAMSGAIEDLITHDELAVFRPVLKDQAVEPYQEFERALRIYKESASSMPTIDFSSIPDWSKIPRSAFQALDPTNPEKRSFLAMNTDPNLGNPAAMPSQVVHGVFIEYEVESDTPVWRSSEVYFATTEEPQLDGKKMVNQLLLHDGKEHISYYDLTRRSAPTAPLTILRWDAVSGYPGVKVRPLGYRFVARP